MECEDLIKMVDAEEAEHIRKTVKKAKFDAAVKEIDESGLDENSPIKYVFSPKKVCGMKFLEQKGNLGLIQDFEG